MDSQKEKIKDRLRRLRLAKLESVKIREGAQNQFTVTISADSQLILLQAIYLHYFGNDSTFVGQANLARSCQWGGNGAANEIKNGTRRVRRTVSALIEQGILIVSKRGNSKRFSNEYQIVWDAIPIWPEDERSSETPAARSQPRPNKESPTTRQGVTHDSTRSQPRPNKESTTTRQGVTHDSTRSQPRLDKESTTTRQGVNHDPLNVDTNKLKNTTTTTTSGCGSSFSELLKELGVVERELCISKARANGVEDPQIEEFLVQAIESKRSGNKVDPGMIYNKLYNSDKSNPPKLPPNATTAPGCSRKKKDVDRREWKRQRLVKRLQGKGFNDKVEDLVDKPFNSGVPIAKIEEDVERFLEQQKDDGDGRYVTHQTVMEGVA